jgi:Zn-dependent protease with chaperone function
MLTPVYVVLVAPLVGLVIRQAISRQREFLADADAALLTRDPGGLVSALVKIGMSRGHLSVSEGSAHARSADRDAGANGQRHREAVSRGGGEAASLVELSLPISGNDVERPEGPHVEVE